MDPNKRTEKKVVVLKQFSGEILVQCPRCQQKATVLADLGEYYSVKSLKFKCPNCFTSINEKKWYGPVIVSLTSNRCGKCGSNLGFSDQVFKKCPEQLVIRCELCKHEQSYSTKCYKTFAYDKQATDPHLGLTLWLQAQVGDDTFWAYNYEHLQVLKDYVAAKLREELVVTKYSMTQKLPEFIMVAKNRERILKVIERLEAKRT